MCSTFSSETERTHGNYKDGLRQGQEEAGQAHIVVKDLTMAYGAHVVMKNLNFTINQRDIFIIMGGSGCGKSTLLKILIGLKEPASGSIFYHDVDFWKADPKKRDEIMQRAGVLYQGGALWSSLTLAENVALPLERYTDLSPKEIRQISCFKLSLVGLSGFENYYPSEISGGMRKRAGLARAIALDPEILFLDEPSAGLDPVSAKHLDDLVMAITHYLKTTVVIVTHELSSILTIGTNSVFLDAATKTQGAVGPPRQLLKHSKNERVRSFLTRDGTLGPHGQKIGQ